MGMTEQEAKWEYYRAIDLIKRIKTEETHERYIDRHKAFDMAIEALEKQIPKKLKTADVGYTMYGCPNCDYTDSLWSLKKRDKHCPDCGQALDWGKIADEGRGNEDAE